MVGQVIPQGVNFDWYKTVPFPLLVSCLGKRKVHNPGQLDFTGSLLEGFENVFLTLTKWTQERNLSGFCLYGGSVYSDA